jgi:hypothetical protein
MSYELFIDGFDHYATANITKKWQETTSTIYTIAPTSGRRGGGALSVGSFPNTNGTIKSKTFTASSKVVVGFALKITTGSLGVTTRFYAGGVLQFSIGMNGSGQFFAQRSGVAVHATSINSFPMDSYNYVEIGVHLADAGSYEVRVNGQSAGWLPATSYDTLVTTGASINQIWFERVPTVTSGAFLDDLYIAYGNELRWLGDSRVDTLALTGNSTPQGWIPNTGNAWEQLNQDVGYISASAVGESSLFVVGNLTHNPQIIHGVQLNGLASKSDTGTRAAALLLNSGATIEGSSVPLSVDTLLIRESYILNPVTASAWSKSDVDAMEVGVKVTA